MVPSEIHVTKRHEVSVTKRYEVSVTKRHCVPQSAFDDGEWCEAHDAFGDVCFFDDTYDVIDVFVCDGRFFGKARV